MTFKTDEVREDELNEAGRKRHKALRALLDKGLSYRAALAQHASRPQDADNLERRENVLR